MNGERRQHTGTVGLCVSGVRRYAGPGQGPARLSPAGRKWSRCSAQATHFPAWLVGGIWAAGARLGEVAARPRPGTGGEGLGLAMSVGGRARSQRPLGR